MIAPEELCGDLVVLAVELKLVGETEDDEIIIGERIRAEVFISEISSDARVADGKAPIIGTVVGEIEPEFFRAIAMSIGRLLDDDLEVGGFDEQQRFALFDRMQIVFEDGALIVEKNFDAIVGAVSGNHFIEREFAGFYPTGFFVVIKILGLHFVLTVIGKINPHHIKQFDVRAVGACNVVERNGAVFVLIMRVRTEPIAGVDVNAGDAIIAVLFAGG